MGGVIGAASGLDRMGRCNKQAWRDGQWGGNIVMDGTSGAGWRCGLSAVRDGGRPAGRNTQRAFFCGGRGVAVQTGQWDERRVERGEGTSGPRDMAVRVAVQVGRRDERPRDVAR